MPIRPFIPADTALMKILVALAALFLGSPVHAESAPTGFVTQILEPTGGKIARPKDWFYAESHKGPVYTWTLSREDSRNNKPYVTGVRIQTFMGVKQGTGQSPEQFIRNFITSRSASAKVLKTCEAEKQSLFMRTCLETEEGPYHILYSLFWGQGDLDLAVVSVAGTTKELWGSYAPVFEKMSAFELIDMQRFEK